MHPRLSRVLLGASLLALFACSGGGDSKAPTIVTGNASMPNSPVFDPAVGNVPLPNVLVTASLTGITYTATSTPAAGTLNINPGYPLTPDKALAFVNLKEMGNTHAVSGVNAPIYIGFSAAVDATTVNASNIKVFQLVPDTPSNPSSLENNALGFTDVSSLFTFSTIALVPSGMGVYATPKVPLLPGTRYLYVVTNRVKDAASGLAVIAPPFFEALKSTTALTGSFAALEPIRANVMAGSNIQLSGYAKVMNDLITASATTTVTSRADIAVLGRFITTGAGYIPPDPVGAASVRIPVEMALWAWANNAAVPSTVDFSTGESRTWSNAVSSFTLLASEAATPGSVAAFYTAAGAGTAPSSAIGLVATGAFESGNLQIDPYAVSQNVTINGNLSAVTGLTYNPGTSTVPGTGVLQASRNATGKLRGFYHTSRTVPFIALAPKAVAAGGTYPVAIFMHGIGGQKEQVLGLANTLCSAGYAVIAIDQAVHGALADGRPSAEWGSNFFMLPSILTARTNVQTSAFHLWRLERLLKQPAGDPTGLQAAMVTAGKPLAAAGATQFVGQSLGSITGAYFLAGNSAQTGGSNMKGLFSVPGGRIGFILKDSPAFAATVNAGLLAAGVPTGSAAYYQFFALAQAVADPIDPATMGTPLSGQATSRLAARLLVQEAVGDTVIPNSNGQYFVNALAGRQGQLGVDVSSGFTQVLRAGQTAPAVPYVYGATLLTTKAAVAAATATGTGNPTQGVMQYGTTAAPAAHGLLLQDTVTPANVAAAQRQMAIWVGAGTVADGAATNGYPIAPGNDLLPMTLPTLYGPESLGIYFPIAQ